MTQQDATFLMNMKMIYQHGALHSKNGSRLNRLLAIHNCHYAVEQILREKGKNLSFSKEALCKITFDEILKKLNENQTIPYYDRLIELNRIRNSAEHSFILTDCEQTRFYVRLVEDFLKWSYKIYFGINYSTLALEDNIIDYPIRKVMTIARDAIAKDDFSTASFKMYEGLGAFKFMWFSFLTDTRLDNIRSDSEYSLAEGFADFAFKILLADDEATLQALSQVRTTLTKDENGKIVGVGSKYLVPLTFKDREEANNRYDAILNIILTYQEKIPFSIWRKDEGTTS